MRDRSELQALKVSDIRSESEGTDFDLYLDNGKDIIPYTVGRHQWSLAERLKLFENRYFVLFYARADALKVARYLAAAPAEPWPYRGKEASVQFLIGDGLAEFIKVRSLYPCRAEHEAVFQNVAERLYQYLSQQSKIHHLLWQLAQHDTHTFYQGARVAAYAVGAALCMEAPRCDRSRLWELALASVLHDLGHLSVDPQLFKRNGPLLKKEWRQIHLHPDETLRLLSQVTLNPYVQEIAIHHHERLDGTGYPHRLPAEALAWEVRLVSLVEAFAALTQPRPYQMQVTPEGAMDLIQSRLQTSVDLSLLQPFQRFLGLSQAKEEGHSSLHSRTEEVLCEPLTID